ncbi:MAG: 30S ribosomal protein S5, partial [Microgenomates group bacterium]
MARPSQPTSEFDEKVIQISRVSKKTKGGNKIGFSVLMVVGDKKGNVG